MKNGLYENSLTYQLKEELSKENYETREVDNSEVSRVVSLAFQKIIRKTHGF